MMMYVNGREVIINEISDRLVELGLGLGTKFEEPIARSMNLNKR